MKIVTVALLLVGLLNINSALKPMTKDCTGGSSYGLYSANLCADNCDANCCGVLGASNSLCQPYLGNIANNITIAQLAGLCGQANNGDTVCSASAAASGAACFVNLQYLQQILAVCNAPIIGAIAVFTSCVSAYGFSLGQLIACCSTDSYGNVLCTSQDFCANTANGYTYAETYCCAVECGYYTD